MRPQQTTSLEKNKKKKRKKNETHWSLIVITLILNPRSVPSRSISNSCIEHRNQPDFRAIALNCRDFAMVKGAGNFHFVRRRKKAGVDSSFDRFLIILVHARFRSYLGMHLDPSSLKYPRTFCIFDFLRCCTAFFKIRNSYRRG